MLFTENNILLDVEVQDKKELLNYITDYADNAGLVIDKEEVLKSFIQREEEYSTGLQEGFAIPHAKTIGVNNSSIIYIRTKGVLEWETFDDKGVQHIFALLVPKNENADHLKMISSLATALMDDRFIENIKKATDKKEIMTIINNEMIGENVL